MTLGRRRLSLVLGLVESLQYQGERALGPPGGGVQLRSVRPRPKGALESTKWNLSAPIVLRGRLRSEDEGFSPEPLSL